MRKWTKRLIRIVYALNICGGVSFLTYLAMEQQKGSYRCNKVLVSFGDELWEDALVTVGEGVEERRLLIYSHFNGVYEETGALLTKFQFSNSLLIESNLR